MMRPDLIPILVMLAFVLSTGLAAAHGCNTEADEHGDCDGYVNITELMNHIGLWYGCGACVPDLRDSIIAYIDNTYYLNVTHNCSDGMLNGDETDVDCGGSCGGCGLGGSCLADADCL
ncbi:MAG: hypothetical protein JXC85_06500, partial [Candidatus Aenigmarchaeota archaeon]|nr:hypothetical protein [Candidatus Aenigmarchaeota archaeon]